MAHYAQVIDGIVTQVLVIEQAEIDTGLWGDPKTWIKTSYNTNSNQHRLGGTPLRGNYAGIGYTYDAENDVFIAPQPFPSWTLSSKSWTWLPPIEYPSDGQSYKWDESTLSWVRLFPD